MESGNPSGMDIEEPLLDCSDCSCSCSTYPLRLFFAEIFLVHTVMPTEVATTGWLSTGVVAKMRFRPSV